MLLKSISGDFQCDKMALVSSSRLVAPMRPYFLLQKEKRPISESHFLLRKPRFDLLKIRDENRQESVTEQCRNRTHTAPLRLDHHRHALLV